MRVKDDQMWAQQVSELKGADEGSRKFLEFLEFWVEQIESFQKSNPDLSLHEALSKAFVVAEQTFGFLSVEWISQMLLVIVQHWESGDRLWESLSVFERRMVEQATAIKLAELQASAEIPERVDFD